MEWWVSATVDRPKIVVRPSVLVSGWNIGPPSWGSLPSALRVWRSSAVECAPARSNLQTMVFRVAKYQTTTRLSGVHENLGEIL